MLYASNTVIYIYCNKRITLYVQSVLIYIYKSSIYNKSPIYNNFNLLYLIAILAHHASAALNLRVIKRDTLSFTLSGKYSKLAMNVHHIHLYHIHQIHQSTLTPFIIQNLYFHTHTRNH